MGCRQKLPPRPRRRQADEARFSAAGRITTTGSHEGLAQPQTAFWDDALARAFAADERKMYVEGNNLATQPLRGRELAKYLEGEYTRTRAIMIGLGLAK